MAANVRHWCLWAIGTIAVVCAARPFVGGIAESVWLVLPVAVFAGSGLKLFPAPRLNAKSRLAQLAMVCVLVAFPIAYYGFLVTVTESPWSMQELLIAIYFFGLSFEIVLLYAFQFLNFATVGLRKRCHNRWRWCLDVSGRCTLYSLLVPFMFVAFGVHRPKLLPRAIQGVPVHHSEFVQFFSRDGRTVLRGVFLHRPHSQGTVIVCHGVGANHSDIEVIHEVLYSLNYQVLTFDFRGHGASDGHTITYGHAERLDVLGAYDFALQHPAVDSSRLFALGVSMGGASLLLALPDMPRVRAAVVDSSFADLRSMVEYQFRWAPRPIQSVLAELGRAFAWMETGTDVNAIKPAETASQLSIPVLVIHGTDDRIIPDTHARRLAAAAPRSTLHLAPDVPHIGTAIANPSLYRKLVSRHFERAIETP